MSHIHILGRKNRPLARSGDGCGINIVSDSSDRETVETTTNGYAELLRLLADTEESAAGIYRLLRRKLVVYFEGRRISPAEDLADEVLHRTAAKIAAGEKIDDINRYVFGIARYVRLESYRQPEFETIDEQQGQGERRPIKTPVRLQVEPKLDPDGFEGSEGPMQFCMHECLRKLPREKKDMLLAYYAVSDSSGTHIEQRSALARRLGKTAGALQKQICLLRQKVSECAHECVRRELG